MKRWVKVAGLVEGDVVMVTAGNDKPTPYRAEKRDGKLVFVPVDSKN